MCTGLLKNFAVLLHLIIQPLVKQSAYVMHSIAAVAPQPWAHHSNASHSLAVSAMVRLETFKPSTRHNCSGFEFLTLPLLKWTIWYSDQSKRHPGQALS